MSAPTIRMKVLARWLYAVSPSEKGTVNRYKRVETKWIWRDLVK